MLLSMLYGNSCTWSAHAGLRRGATTPVSETDGVNSRETSLPAIGFIVSPDVYCYQPDPKKDECYITWGEISVDASPAYMNQLSIEINGRIVAVNSGFFQTSMSIPANMSGNGFKVKCGRLGAGGFEEFGNAYPFIIRARDSNNLSSANYGTAYCPAHVK